MNIDRRISTIFVTWINRAEDACHQREFKSLRDASMFMEGYAASGACGYMIMYPALKDLFGKQDFRTMATYKHPEYSDWKTDDIRAFAMRNDLPFSSGTDTKGVR